MIRRAVDVYRRQGWAGVWFGALARAQAYRRLELIELDLTGELPAFAPDPLGLRFGFLEPDELHALGRLGGQWTPADAEARIARGERCFAARRASEVVSARWVATSRGWIEYLGTWLPLEPGEAYLYESFTLPELRGRGISPAVGTRFARALADEGARRVLAAVLRESREGTRAYEKVGYRRIGRVGYVKLGPWRKDFLRAGDR